MIALVNRSAWRNSSRKLGPAAALARPTALIAVSSMYSGSFCAVRASRSRSDPCAGQSGVAVVSSWRARLSRPSKTFRLTRYIIQSESQVASKARRMDSGRRFGAHGHAIEDRQRHREARDRRPVAQHGLVELEAGAPYGRDAGLHHEQIVEAGRRDEVGDAAGDREHEPVRIGQEPVIEADARAATRCGRARRISGSWHGRRCRPRRCPRSRPAPAARGRSRRVALEQLGLGRDARLARSGPDAAMPTGSACGRAACAGAAPAAAGTARPCPPACRAAPTAPRRWCRSRPGRRRS